MRVDDTLAAMRHRALLLAVTCSLPLVAVSSARADAPVEEELVEIDAQLAAHPHDLLLLLTHADLYLEAGEPLRSLDDLALASALAPRDPHVPALRAEALAALDRLDEALVEITRAARLGLRTPRLLVLRARLLTRADRREEALVAWDEALSVAADLDGFLTRSALLDQLGRADAALAGLEEGLGITGSTVLRLEVIERRAARGEIDRAIDLLAPLLATRAGAMRARWWLMRAELLSRAGRDAEARADYEAARSELTAIARHRPSAAVRLELARALFGLHRVDEAAIETRRALASSPGLEGARELEARIARAQRGAR